MPIRFFVCLLVVLFSLSGSLLWAQPAPVASYSFDNTLAADGAGPALTPIDPLGQNAFQTASVFGQTRTVYRFDGAASPPASQAGFSLDMSGLTTGGAYSVTMVFRFFEQNNAYRRILDASNRSSDSGFYVDPSNQLEVFPTGGGPTIWTNNDFHTVALTNDGAGTVTCYLDGVFQFNLSTNVMDFATYPANPGSLLIFFADNTAGSGLGEFSDGQIAAVSVYNVALTDEDVARTASQEEQPIPTLGEWGLLILLGLLILVGVRKLAAQ